MIKIGLRDARCHMRRFVMSIIAIALGVAFVVGSFCFSEMLNSQIDSMMASNSDADVYVSSSVVKKGDDKNKDSSNKDDELQYEDIDPDLTAELEKVDGVSSAKVFHSYSDAVLVKKDGTAVNGGGAPTLMLGINAEHPWRAARLTSGHWPENEHEIALHSGAEKQSGLKVGNITKIVLPDGPQDFKVVGTFDTDAAQMGASLVAIAPELAKQLYMEDMHTDKVGTIGVYGDEKTPLDAAAQEKLAEEIRKELAGKEQIKVETGDKARSDDARHTKEQLGFIQPLIMVFAIIALFVGSFIIANTFTMIVRDSMRGYALLRSVGASPAQVFLTVVVQAVVLGVIGSVIGVLLGWGLLELIAQGMNQMGYALSGSAKPSVMDIVWGVAIGVVVSVLGASLPAKAAATAPPIQAMNETVNPEKPVKKRGIIGAVMIVLGALSWWLAYGLATSDGNPTPWDGVNSMNDVFPVSFGSAMLIIGVIVIGPALVGPAGKVLGWIPDHVFPVTGKLASRNIARAKRRTANTAAALFVGIAIVSCLGVLAGSVKASVNDKVDTGINTDFIIQSASMNTPLQEKAVADMEKISGIEGKATIRFLYGSKVDGKEVTTGITQPSLVRYAPPTVQEGDGVQALETGEMAVGKNLADKYGWRLGQKVTLKATTMEVDKEATAKAMMANPQAEPKMKEVTKSENITIGAIIDDSLYADMTMINQKTADKVSDSSWQILNQLYIKAKPGANLAQMRKDLMKIAKPYYTIAVMDKDEFKSSMGAMINQMLAIIYALLALSIVIAIFGIVNTLALNVSERTKEIGLLRAVGTSNGQVRGMLAIESVILSVYGTILGIVVGTFAGMVLRAVYASQGLNKLVIPWIQLLWFLLVAILVGLIASLSPANRALKQPVLDAVKSE